MRTRFAPSPTGSLHVGGLRTALFSYIVARQTKGEFLLRIEDTDQAREVAGSIDVILKGLGWAGIPPDEGVIWADGGIAQKGSHGPYKQSERLPLYKEHAEKLLKSGHAYHCFCTSERLDQMRKDQELRKLPPMYDRQCLHLKPEEVSTRIAAGEPFVIRLKVPRDRTIEFDDDIRGRVSFQGKTIDDQVLMKSDGFPTYHLAHVVDDHLMDIGIVIRGEEWLSSLPKHLLLFEAFEWTPPRYAHVPLLLNADRSKLSKRQGSVSVEEYIGKGYLPEALLNFLALLGWNPGTTQEMFSLDELIAAFTIDRIQKAGAVFDLTKLDWLQGQWMRKLTTEEFLHRVTPYLQLHLPDALKDKGLEKKLSLIQARITFAKEAPEMLAFFYAAPTVSKDLLISAKQKVSEADLPTILEVLKETLEPIDAKKWNEDTLKTEIQAVVAKGGWKLGQLLWPLRAALTGREYSPGAFEVAGLLGKEETMKRLKAVV